MQTSNIGEPIDDVVTHASQLTDSGVAKKPNIKENADNMNMIQKLNRQPKEVSAIQPPAIGPKTRRQASAIDSRVYQCK